MAHMMLSPVARAVMDLCGEMPIDELHEFAFDFGDLLRRIRKEEVRLFNEAYIRAKFTQGLEVSPYFVSEEINPGYAGTYLN